MQALKITKAIVGLVSGYGAGMIVNNVAKATAPIGAGMISRVVLMAGSFALGGLVGKVTSDYSEDMIDETIKVVKGLGDKTTKVHILPS
jgi:hypothetical protein